MLRVLGCSAVCQAFIGHGRHTHCLIEFAVRRQPSITRDLRPVKLQLQPTVKIDS